MKSEERDKKEKSGKAKSNEDKKTKKTTKKTVKKTTKKTVKKTTKKPATAKEKKGKTKCTKSKETEQEKETTAEWTTPKIYETDEEKARLEIAGLPEDTEPEIIEMLEEDLRRRKKRYTELDYDPITGKGSFGERIEAETPVEGLPKALIPKSMMEDPEYVSTKTKSIEWRKLRCRHDFEYWTANCVKIRDKATGQTVAFRLNRPQRRVASILESDRLAGIPIRMIMLKARQWGGSTLIQMYMAWIQLCHRKNWNSLICAHVKDTAGTIRGMYSSMLASYPKELWEGEAGSEPEFKPFERSINIRQINGRGCRVTIGSSENQEAVRGADYAMAHLSETAFWQATGKKSPKDFIRAICGSVALQPLTMIVMESTANGVGNYFHREWIRASKGRSDKRAVFVPWYEIDLYTLETQEPVKIASEIRANDYLQSLWDSGCTLAQIHWYVRKSAEYASQEQMKAEFPSNPKEAFVNSGYGVFSYKAVEKMRETCEEGEKGEVGMNLQFQQDERGKLTIWRQPEEGMDYIVAVDIGGRSEESDWSVAAVMSVPKGGSRRPEIAAQWRGHADHDILAWKTVALAEYYNSALLVIESNTLESENGMYNYTDDANLFILNRIAEVYPNIYRRRSFDTLSQQPSYRIGFHTNRQTKPMLVAELVEAVREGQYIEHDQEACNELITYQQMPTGAYAARQGCHDDILMTRAMLLFVSRTEYYQTEIPASAEGRIRRPWRPQFGW